MWHYRYNKPLQASVRAVTNGTLWTLKREDFRGILVSEFSNLSSLKLLRSVDLLSRLSILQLSQISDSLSEVTFSSGQTIINKVSFLASVLLCFYSPFFSKFLACFAEWSPCIVHHPKGTCKINFWCWFIDKSKYLQPQVRHRKWGRWCTERNRTVTREARGKLFRWMVPSWSTHWFLNCCCWGWCCMCFTNKG